MDSKVNTINIGTKGIGGEYPCYIIAEMSANHAGDIKRAIEIIHTAKDIGADCVKIQTYTPDTITINSRKEYFLIKDGNWKGENLYELYGKAYTPWEWQKELKLEAEKIGIDFLSTPFDKTSVDFLEELGVGFYKIASCELIDIPLIKYVASRGKPIIMSTGMATLEEIEEAVNTVRSQLNNGLCLLKCSAAYPAISEDMNLRTIKHLAETFRVPVGLSDHTLGTISAIVAVAVGAKVIEKHLCMSRDIDNPDAAFSMEPREFQQMIKDVREAEKAIGQISYKVSKREEISRTFRKSIFVVKDIKKGDKFTSENVRIIRPGHGLAPKFIDDIIGRRSVEDIEQGTPLNRKMVQ